ncbi:MAG: protein kinase, partial [Holophagales bacterium]|nr:protein kinase [Holophagales bacterium]
MQVGEQIGHLRIAERIGEGANGAVYAGFDERLKREVAVKVLHREYREPTRRGLLAEARALSQLDHPNICRVFDLMEGDALYLMLERVHGRTLAGLLAESSRPPGGLRIAEQIASAL